MIMITMGAIVIIVIMLIIALISNKLEKKNAAQEENKQLTCEGVPCNDIITFDNQQQMVQHIIVGYSDSWIQDISAVYFMKKGIIIEYKRGWKVYYTYSA